MRHPAHYRRPHGTGIVLAILASIVLWALLAVLGVWLVGCGGAKPVMAEPLDAPPIGRKLVKAPREEAWIQGVALCSGYAVETDLWCAPGEPCENAAYWCVRTSLGLVGAVYYTGNPGAIVIPCAVRDEHDLARHRIEHEAVHAIDDDNDEVTWPHGHAIFERCAVPGWPRQERA